MTHHIISLVLGFLCIAKGGDMFVDASVEIARALKVPRMVIGATIVSIATTVPELTVSTMASVIGDSGIALGNAVGSAIANIGLIVGILGLITSVKIDLVEFRRRFLWMIASALLVILFAWYLRIPRLFAAVLIVVSIAYLFFEYIQSRSCRTQPSQSDKDSLKRTRLGGAVLWFLIGVALVIVGSRLLVVSGIFIAHSMGVPSVIIGLSVIAIGTSLPELVTGITAARKGVPDLSIGNIIGANVLNLAMIVGVSGVILPLTLSRFTQLYSFPWLLVFIIGMYYLFRKDGKLNRKEAFVLLMLYFVYLGGLFLLPGLGIF